MGIQLVRRSTQAGPADTHAHTHFALHFVATVHASDAHNIIGGCRQRGRQWWWWLEACWKRDDNGYHKNTVIARAQCSRGFGCSG